MVVLLANESHHHSTEGSVAECVFCVFNFDQIGKKLWIAFDSFDDIAYRCASVVNFNFWFERVLR